MARYFSFGVVALALGITATVEAFLSSDTCTAKTSHGRAALGMSSSIGEESDTPPSRKRGPEMSVAIPFLGRPPLLTGELAGDVGFDPLRLSKNKEALWEYREAEIKHARLAMLAAAGWPLSELLDRNIADFYGIETTLDAADRAPSLLNGGMEKVSPIFWGFCLGLTAAIDLYGVARARAAGTDSDYVPGDLGFDPLGLLPKDKEGRKNMQLAEIKHGRIAMLAAVGFGVQEATSQVGVVDETPFFFQPITETVAQILQGLAN